MKNVLTTGVFLSIGAGAQGGETSYLPAPTPRASDLGRLFDTGARELLSGLNDHLRHLLPLARWRGEGVQTPFPQSPNQGQEYLNFLSQSRD